MYRRKRNRVKMVLAVRVIGHDAEGKKFELLTHTLDISMTGTRVGGMSLIPLKSGDIIDVQRKHLRGKFRVTWVGEGGTPKTGQVGLELVSAPPEFWGLDLPIEGEQALSLSMQSAPQATM
jgi:hypothetical protein